MDKLAPEKWKRQYPCLPDTGSPRGPYFQPEEKGSFARIQLYSEDFTCHWIDVWVELKGHSFEVYNEESAKEPLLCFDLKESVALQAAKGLPGSAPDLSCGRVGIFSRYYVNKTLACNLFVFEFPDATQARAWLTGLELNREWALRFSGLYHPQGTCAVYCDELEGRRRVNKRFMNTSMVKYEDLHERPVLEADIEKLGGSKLEGRFQGLRPVERASVCVCVCLRLCDGVRLRQRGVSR